MMDMKTLSTTAAACQTLFDGFDERPVDMDFVLPDYYPDIAAVLKCQLKPMVQSRQISGNRVLVDGVTAIRVMYLDEARQCVRSVEFTQPFSSAFTVADLTPDACIRVTTKTDYVNCRATSPRRLDVHGAFSVKLKATTAGGVDMLQDVEGESFQKRHTTFVCSVPAVSADKSFTISEVLELESGKPPAEALIRGEAVPVLTDCKIMMNKVILKGCLYLRHLYAGDVTAGRMEQVEHEVPFSQIVDVEGLQDDWQCDVDLEVTASDVHISVNQSGEGTLLSVSIKLAAHIACVRSEEATALTDAYSTCCPLHMETRTVETEQLTGIHRDTEVVRETFDLPPDDIAGIVDLWGEASVVSERCESDKCMVDGRLMVYMLTRNAAGEVSYYERPVDLPLEYTDDCNRTDTSLCVVRMEYVVNSQKQMELKVELAVTRRCYRTNRCAAVCAVTADENEAFPAERAALKIYYANAGESLWEIAKSCHTSMEEVMKENDLAADVLTEDAMLLVPLC